jgi:hypothetical protein
MVHLVIHNTRYFYIHQNDIGSLMGFDFEFKFLELVKLFTVWSYLSTTMIVTRAEMVWRFCGVEFLHLGKSLYIIGMNHRQKTPCRPRITSLRQDCVASPLYSTSTLSLESRLIIIIESLGTRGPSEEASFPNCQCRL